VSVKNVERSYRDHAPRFQEGKHTYLLDYAEAKSLLSSIGEIRSKVRVFTEQGYLLLVKPMRDERSWHVQEWRKPRTSGSRASQERDTLLVTLPRAPVTVVRRWHLARTA
jgi:hypothetical protein